MLRFVDCVRPDAMLMLIVLACGEFEVTHAPVLPFAVEGFEEYTELAAEVMEPKRFALLHDAMP